MMELKFFVFDTNILISAFLFSNSVPRHAYEKAKELGVIVRSPEIFEEFDATFRLPKFDRYLSIDKRLSDIKAFEEDSILLRTDRTIRVCRDPKDNMLLELAVTVDACCIVTGDKDLRVLDPFLGKIRILTAVDFISLF